MPLIISEIFLLFVQFGVLSWIILLFFSSIISSRHGAPYVPMKNRLVKELLHFGGVGAGDIFYDLGSGDGRVLISAVRDFRAGRATGYEAAPWPYWKSRWLIRSSGYKNIEVRNKNFFDGDYSDAAFIYLYLFPKLVDKLAEKFSGELKTGTKILCPSFPINPVKHPEFVLKKSQKIGIITAYLYEKI